MRKWLQVPWLLLWATFLQSAIYLSHLPPQVYWDVPHRLVSRWLYVFVPPLIAALGLWLVGWSDFHWVGWDARRGGRHHGSINSSLTALASLALLALLLHDAFNFSRYLVLSTVPRVTLRWIGATFALIAAAQTTRRPGPSHAAALFALAAALAMVLCFTWTPEGSLATSLLVLGAGWWSRSRHWI